MSVEKRLHEARRWLEQAAADLKAAADSRRAGNHEWACFQCQQAGEKSLKALWIRDGHDPWGHSLLRLLEEHPDERLRNRFAPLRESASLLDKLDIPTRYPNGLPDLTPSKVYGEPDALAAHTAAEQFVALARGELAGS
jgi:HEPN domain-containing protein